MVYLDNLPKQKLQHMVEMYRAGRLLTFLSSIQGHVNPLDLPRTRLETLSRELILLPKGDIEEETALELLFAAFSSEKG